MANNHGLKLPIYMDNNATTPVDPRVLEAMLPYFSEIFGNAASVDHLFGNAAQNAVEQARDTVSGFINARSPEEVIFTSGATESDNIALIGIAEAYADKGNHIITSAIEHKAVLDTLEYLKGRGVESTILPVDQFGMVDPNDVAKAITDRTVLISIMFANNEIGTIQPIKAIGEIARNHGVFFHTDAAQAVGHVPVDVEQMNIDLMSFTAHKINGPKGVGALYVRRRNPRVKPATLVHGGGHERGMRSGTLNVAGIVGFSKAIALSRNEMEAEGIRHRQWTNQMFDVFESGIQGVERNGHPLLRLPGNLNVFIPKIESRALVLDLNDVVAFSTGSACTTAKVEPSHVINALGFGEERAYGSVRFGLGRKSTEHETEEVGNQIVSRVASLRQTFSNAVS